MPVRASRFEAPVTQPPKLAPTRQEALEPVEGLNVSRPASNLSPGETPASQNWVLHDRYIQPRSGLSQYVTSGLTYSAIPTMVAVAERVDRSQFLYTQYTSSATTAYASSAVIYDSTQSYANNILVYTNWVTVPQFVSVGFDAASASAVTGIYSLASYARYVASVDDRLMFFHTATASSSSVTGTYPSRVMWSAKGVPQDFVDGGYQDVVAMQGGGTALVAEADRAVLLTEREVWVARPRLDSFAFDFFNLDKTKGLPSAYARTVANTEAGTLWLGAGPQPYRLVNNEVRALGDKVRSQLSALRETSALWALSSPDEHLYALFYSDSSGSYAQKALFLRTDTIEPVGGYYGTRDDGAWFAQTFPFGIANGAVLNGAMVLVSSAGTQYRLLSTQTNDAGTAIDARWRSSALRGPDIFPLEGINDFWLEYRNDSAVTVALAIYTTADDGQTFGLASSVSLPPGNDVAHAAVTPVAARQPMYELRIADGSRPMIARIQATLRGYTGRLEGGRG